VIILEEGHIVIEQIGVYLIRKSDKNSD